VADHLEQEGLLDSFRKDYAERRKMRGEPGTLEKVSKIPIWESPLPEEEFLDSYVCQRAVEFIEFYTDRKPLCLVVGFPGSHESWDAPGRYASMYDPKKIPDPILAGIPGRWVPEAVVECMKQEQLADNMSIQDIKRATANYCGKISLIDDWIGKILFSFEKLKDPENTLVVFWSDHGEMFGDHQCLYKSVFYESSVRVPLIISWPSRVQEGKICKFLVEIIDIYPTILEAAGANPLNAVLVNRYGLYF